MASALLCDALWHRRRHVSLSRRKISLADSRVTTNNLGGAASTSASRAGSEQGGPGPLLLRQAQAGGFSSLLARPMPRGISQTALDKGPAESETPTQSLSPRRPFSNGHAGDPSRLGRSERTGAPSRSHRCILMVSPRSPPIFLHYSETPPWKLLLAASKDEGLDPTEKEQKGRKQDVTTV
jgi:hypothetical protein